MRQYAVWWPGNSGLRHGFAQCFVVGIFSFLVITHSVNAQALIGPAGDLVPDGQINAGDYLILQQIVLGERIATAEQQLVGDVAPLGSPDGQLNAGDLVVLSRAITGADIDLNVLFDLDVSGFPAGHSITPDEMQSILGRSGTPSGKFARNLNAGLVTVENDPFGGNSKVMAIQFKKGKAGIGDDITPSSFQATFQFAERSDVYMMMEIGVDGNWITPKGLHMPQILSTPFVASRSPDPSTWAAFFQMYGNNAFVDTVTNGAAKINTADDSLWMYYYDQSRAQGAWPYDSVDTSTSNSDLPRTTQVQLVRNGYITLEQRLKLNDVGSANGIFQAWANGKLVLDHQGRTIRTATDPAGINQVALTWWSGGSAHDDAQWGGAQDQKMYVRRFTVSTAPLSH